MQHNSSTDPNFVAGACFVHQGRKYRLNSFLCEIVDTPIEHELLKDLFADWGAEEAASLPAGMRRIKLRHCLHHEATFVSGSGVGGCVVGIDEIELDGMVGWSDQQLAEHQQTALRKGQEGRYVVSVIRPITTTEEA